MSKFLNNLILLSIERIDELKISYAKLIYSYTMGGKDLSFILPAPINVMATYYKTFLAYDKGHRVAPVFDMARLCQRVVSKVNMLRGLFRQSVIGRLLISYLRKSMRIGKFYHMKLYKKCSYYAV